MEIPGSIWNHWINSKHVSTDTHRLLMFVLFCSCIYLSLTSNILVDLTGVLSDFNIDSIFSFLNIIIALLSVY